MTVGSESRNVDPSSVFFVGHEKFYGNFLRVGDGLGARHPSRLCIFCAPQMNAQGTGEFDRIGWTAAAMGLELNRKDF